MAQVPNQFKQTTEQGAMDLRFPGQTMSVQIDSSESGTLNAGHAVKIVDSAGGIPKVIATTADEDDALGFITRDPKKNSFVAGDQCEITVGSGAVMYMTASAAIARGGKVMTVPASDKIATATSGNMVVGRALDKAAADGDLIRVLITLPGALLA